MLISCVAYQDGTKIGDITAAQIAEYLQRPHCFVWVALQDPSAAELAEMQKAFDLHPLAVEDALVGHQRPKVDEYGDSLFAVLHLVEPTSGEYHVGELAIFAGPNYIVTVRSRAQKGLAEVRARCEREPQLLCQGPGFVLHAVAPLLEGVSNLTGGRVPALCVNITEYFRDIYDHLLRLNPDRRFSPRHHRDRDIRELVLHHAARE
jgi:magnesium transporter